MRGCKPAGSNHHGTRFRYRGGAGASSACRGPGDEAVATAHRAGPRRPLDNSLEIAARVEAQDVRATLIKDGEHQLVRPSDMGLMLRELDDFTLTS